MKRRDFIKFFSSLALLGNQSLATGVTLFDKKIDKKFDKKNALMLSMPEESSAHLRTWMAFVANDHIWSTRQIPQVKADLINIARTIAKYEPVSMLVNEYDYQEAQERLRHVTEKYPIDLIQCPVDDLWLRDTGPTFVSNGMGKKVGIDFNFNGWGDKQVHSKDAKVAQFIVEKAKAILQRSRLVLEGGCFEVDGHGTAILTESCVLNDNRNPGLSQIEVEDALKALLGLQKIIWLEGVKGKDITDGHTDFYARFVRQGVVAVSRDNYSKSFDYQVTRKNIATLSHSTDAHGMPLKLLILDTPEIINEDFGVADFAAGYVGYYVCNGAVIMQKFGDKSADARARKIIAAAYPEHVIEQIAIDGIASGGGSIHCATQQEIKL